MWRYLTVFAVMVTSWSSVKVQLEKLIRPVQWWSEVHFWLDLHMHCFHWQDLLNSCLLLHLQHHLQCLWPALGLQALIPVQLPPLLCTPCSLPLSWDGKGPSPIYSPVKFLNHSSRKKLKPQFSPFSSFLALYQALILSFCSLLFSTPYCTSALFTPPLNQLDLNSFFPAEPYLNIMGRGEVLNNKPQANLCSVGTVSLRCINRENKSF